MVAALDGNYHLANNINLTNVLNNKSEVWGTQSSTASGKGFYPVGTGSNTNSIAGTEFIGTLDGHGNIINGLYINNTSQPTFGLFGSTGTGVTLQNISITNANISGDIGRRYSRRQCHWQ